MLSQAEFGREFFVAALYFAECPNNIYLMNGSLVQFHALLHLRLEGAARLIAGQPLNAYAVNQLFVSFYVALDLSPVLAARLVALVAPR